MLSLTLTPEAVTKLDALVGNLTLSKGGQTTALAHGVARALSSAAISARTAMVAAVAADLGVQDASVAKYVRTKDATVDKLEARVYAWGKKGIPLIKVDPTGANRPPHAFLATMPRNGHRGIFQRKPGANRRGPKPNRSQLPIEELHTRPVPQVFAAHREAGIAQASAALSTSLVSEISYALHSGA